MTDTRPVKGDEIVASGQRWIVAWVSPEGRYISTVPDERGAWTFQASDVEVVTAPELRVFLQPFADELRD